MSRLPAACSPMLLLLILLAGCQPPQLYSPREAYRAPQDPARAAVERFFTASGGLEEMRDLHSVSCAATIEAYDYQYEMHLLEDGRFRIEAPDRTTVYDGREYWQSYHGLVHPVAGDERERLADVSLREVFLHGFLKEDGELVQLSYAGEETRRGQTWDLLERVDPDGDHRTYYLNRDTGLLDKIVILSPDPDYRELKTVYTLRDYQEVAGRRLPTLVQAQCLTNGEEVQPRTRFSEMRINQAPESALFVRPASDAPPARLHRDALEAQVLAISGGGSLITSITESSLDALGADSGDLLQSEVRGNTAHLIYVPQLQDAGQIEPGDYLATFNRTPALWLVKAYVGMTSDDSTYAVGDAVRLSIASAAEGDHR
ncbi:MAG: hypothetical protein GF330_12815 [Candidatus Eisenbacteria bacterium]|nr:hypothetical protein [Candidatus Eisenbacteria bacterium]